MFWKKKAGCIIFAYTRIFYQTKSLEILQPNIIAEHLFSMLIFLIYTQCERKKKLPPIVLCFNTAGSNILRPHYVYTLSYLFYCLCFCYFRMWTPKHHRLHHTTIFTKHRLNQVGLALLTTKTRLALLLTTLKWPKESPLIVYCNLLSNCTINHQQSTVIIINIIIVYW